MSALPAGVRRDHPLARLTTIRTGGSAEYFARPGTVEELSQALRWAAEAQVEVGVVGSGSNLLVADAGVRGLVLKLDRDLSHIEPDGSHLECGGGARLPAASAYAARVGLSGIEFGVNIPGTVGGAVRMNANAYGGELARTLEWAEVVSAAGIERRPPESLGFAYRRSGLHTGEVVSRARFALTPADPATVRASLAGMPSSGRVGTPRSRPASRRAARGSRTRPTRGPRVGARGCCSTRRGAAGW